MRLKWLLEDLVYPKISKSILVEFACCVSCNECVFWLNNFDSLTFPVPVLDKLSDFFDNFDTILVRHLHIKKHVGYWLNFCYVFIPLILKSFLNMLPSDDHCLFS